MDIIYRQALITIVSLSTSKCSDRLPGIGPGMKWRNLQERIDGRQYVALPYSALYNQLSESVYESRGWTFSERMLSPRCLYMTDDFVKYHCKHGHVDDDWKLDNKFEEFVFKPFNQDISAATQARGTANRRLYETLVRVYTKRELTDPGDKLNAFRAALAMLGFEDSGGTLCGLPEAYLDEALLWRPLASITPLARNPRFASWSWAGWTGHVEYRYVHREINAEAIIIQHSFQTKRRTTRRDLSMGGSAVVHSGIDVLYITTETVGAKEFNFTVRAGLTSRLACGVYYRGGYVGFLYLSGSVVGSADPLLFSGREKNLCSIIKLSTVDDKDMVGDKSVLVLLITSSHPEEGYAERIAIGQLNWHFWESLFKVTREIALG